METAKFGAAMVADREIRPLIADLLISEIVKRVVTVKQARPSGWAWAWVCRYAGARRPGGAKSHASAPAATVR